MSNTNGKAFTLIELSIVLVIIGLIVGGVLVGRDLIAAAAVRAQISQIERYNSAINTFRGKYNNYLPADLPEPYATQFGFQARGSSAGQGDGNGLIEGYAGCTTCNNMFAATGENLLFWSDLSITKLIDFTFSGSCCGLFGSPVTGSSLNRYYPEAKIGNNKVYMYGYTYNPGYTQIANIAGNQNMFGVSVVTTLGSGTGWGMDSLPGMTVQQAYAIDKKTDDGFPQSGKVQAAYNNYQLANYCPVYAAGGGVEGGLYNLATPPSSTTCYDNANTLGATQQYSVSQSGGKGVNCALSFRLQ